jgi:urease accessory protein
LRRFAARLRAEMTGSRYPRLSELSLHIKQGADGAVLDRAFFTAPFKITNPFRTDEGRMRIMLVAVSAGLLAGDTQKIGIRVGRGAEAEIVSQSFEKVHRMGERETARRETSLFVESGALLSYTPLPVIPFAHSAFEGRTDVRLGGSDSRFVYSDVLCCGRASRGERFAWRTYRHVLRVFLADRLIYFDNGVYIPSETDMEGFGLFEGFSHLSTLLLFNIPVSPEQYAEIGRTLSRFPDGTGGLSRTGSGALAVRTLGSSADAALEQHAAILTLLR